MDVFSCNLFEPKFPKNLILDEANNVNSEFQKDLNIDGWRFEHILKTMASEDNPYHQFNIGNLETFKSISPDELIK